MVAACQPSEQPVLDALASSLTVEEKLARASRLSCQAAGRWESEVAECWEIISCMVGWSGRRALAPRTAKAPRIASTPMDFVYGAIHYLEQQYVQSLAGGTPNQPAADPWDAVLAAGRSFFMHDARFPCSAAHTWYVIFCAFRAGSATVLKEIPQRIASVDLNAGHREVCRCLAAFLESPGAESVDEAQLQAADLETFSNQSPHGELLAAFLLGRKFNINTLPQAADGLLGRGAHRGATALDWLWWRLRVCARKGLPPAGLCEVQTKIKSLPGDFFDSEGRGAGGLEYVKMLLLSLQFSSAIFSLYSAHPALRTSATHLALAMGIQKLFATSDQLVEIAETAGDASAASFFSAERRALPGGSVCGLVLEYSSRFSFEVQLQHIKVLENEDRTRALVELLTCRGGGSCEEVTGWIQEDGTVKPGLMRAATNSDREFTLICAEAGRAAELQGNYVGALRLLHIAGLHAACLQVLKRCVILPVWTHHGSNYAELQVDLRRMFRIYSVNKDTYGVSATWPAFLWLFHSRSFLQQVSEGRFREALATFDEHCLLPLAPGARIQGDLDDLVVAELGGVVEGYLQAIEMEFRTGDANTAGHLRARVGSLQAFLATHSHIFQLTSKAAALISSLSLS